MSFPPRHPMALPGMPTIPGMIPPGYAFPHMAPMMPMGMMPGHILPPGIPMQAMQDARAMNHRGLQPRKPMLPRRIQDDHRRHHHQHPSNQGPTITVFVGNITERAIDNLVKQILQKCGTVVSWKRVQGASGKLQAFGFCEYGDPESALRAIRILHDWEIADKKLVVKVDAKTKAQLDEYKANKRKLRQEVDNAGNKTPTESERDDYDEIDEDTKKEDSIIRTGIQVLLKEHEYDLTRPLPPSESRKRKTQEKNNVEDEIREPKDQNLDEMDLEEDKKNLIHREIDKFRDTMKKLEEEKEKERERREKDRERRDRDRDRERDRRAERDTTNNLSGISGSLSNRLHNHTPDRIKELQQQRDRSRERSYDRSRSRSHERDRSRDRERSREREIALQERVREKEYERDKREKDKEREREEEEDAYERRKLERKLREKEAAYQERLRSWETRERKKVREYEKYKEKEEEKRNDEIKEAKRLKEFLEDYEDERDDGKYYKGSALSRRLKEREKEIENDNRDRQREKEEIEELKQKLLEEGHPDPTAELERIRKETEERFRPVVKLLEPIKERIENKMRPVSGQRSRSPDEPKIPVRKVQEDDNTQNSLSGISDITTPKEKEDIKQRMLAFTNLKLNAEATNNHHEVAVPVKEEPKPKLMGFSGLKLAPSSPTHSGNSAASNSGGAVVTATSANNASSGGRKKKLTVGEVFNTDEDESGDGQPKKRKLVPLDYSEDEKKAIGQAGTGGSNQEEKRKHIKNLIDKIPTEKDKLFAYEVDWGIVDSVLMERRIKPWINKKIVEYIGEEEPTLVDFICSKLMAGSTPQSILDDVQMVLDDEAEVFVVKMWRLLIYEIEAKKLGLVK